MLETVILYNGVLLLCYLIARHLDKKPIYIKFSLFIIILALSFVCGFRSYNIGSDTHTYINMLNAPEASLSMEYGFRMLCKALLSIRFSKELVIFTISLITNALFCYGLFFDVFRDKANACRFYCVFFNLLHF